MPYASVIDENAASARAGRTAARSDVCNVP